MDAEDTEISGCPSAWSGVFAPTHSIHIMPSARTAQVYRKVHKTSGQVPDACGSHNALFYGELTPHSMERVCRRLVTLCGLNAMSRILDVGSGQGKPTFHFLELVGFSFGIEICEDRKLVSTYFPASSYTATPSGIFSYLRKCILICLSCSCPS